MNYFFITQREGVLPRPEPFQELLCARWPRAQVEEVRNPSDLHALEFNLPMRHSQVYGSLNRRGDSVVFVGDLRDCAEFALWCQSLLPPGETGTFCDESMSGSVDLAPSTTLAHILQSFSE